MINNEIKILSKVKGKWFFLSVLAVVIGFVIITLIREKGKSKRIDKLNQIEYYKIEVIGNYEEKAKSNFSNK